MKLAIFQPDTLAFFVHVTNRTTLVNRQLKDSIVEIIPDKFYIRFEPGFLYRSSFHKHHSDARGISLAIEIELDKFIEHSIKYSTFFSFFHFNKRV